MADIYLNDYPKYINIMDKRAKNHRIAASGEITHRERQQKRIQERELTRERKNVYYGSIPRKVGKSGTYQVSIEFIASDQVSKRHGVRYATALFKHKIYVFQTQAYSQLFPYPPLKRQSHFKKRASLLDTHLIL